MPIKLDDIVTAKKDQTFTVVIPVETQNGGEPHTENLNIVYRPATQRVLNLVIAGDVAKALSLVLVDADIQDKNGNKIEPTEEFLSEQPLEFLGLLAENVIGDMSPKKKR